MKAGDWLNDLERLHRQGLSDSQIAHELSRRYPSQTFTRRRVWHWRHLEDRMSQLGECIPRDRMDLQHRRAVHQLLRGFGHLLPLPLRFRESDILQLLRQRGPLTRPRIAEALGIRTTLNTRGQRWLYRLRCLGLIQVIGTVQGKRRPLPLYALTSLALPDTDEPLN